MHELTNVYWPWMQCKSLWIKACAKSINVNGRCDRINNAWKKHIRNKCQCKFNSCFDNCSRSASLCTAAIYIQLLFLPTCSFLVIGELIYCWINVLTRCFFALAIHPTCGQILKRLQYSWLCCQPGISMLMNSEWVCQDSVFSNYLGMTCFPY